MPHTTVRLLTMWLLTLLVGAMSAEAEAAKYLKLSRVGVQAKAASVSGQKLTVTVRVRQRTSVKLEVMKGKRVMASAKAKVVKKGRHRVVVELDRRLSAGSFRLRLTVKNLKTRKRGRGFIPLKLLFGSGPAPTPTPTPTPTPSANQPPSQIAAKGASVEENKFAGTAVVTLAAVDPDGTDVHRFTLVAGTGDADNALFTIVGSVLTTAAPLDFEQQASRSVRVRVDDGRGGIFEQALTIAVIDVNDAPTAPALSAQSVPETAPPGTVVGVLTASDADAGQSVTFSLVSGVGDADNASFAIDGNALETATALDYETKSSYTVRIQSDDGHGGATADQFSIVVTDAVEGPALTMSGAPLQYTEDTAAVAVDPGLVATAPDGTTLTGATVSVSANFEPGDVLAYSTQNGITGSYAAGTGVLTLIGSASPAAYQQALRTVTFRTDSQAPKTSKAVQVVLHAGVTSSPPATRPVTVAAINDAPVADADSYGGGQRGIRMRVGTTHADTHEVEVAGRVLDGDSDVDTPASNLTATPGMITTADGGTVTMASDGSFTYDPAAGDDGSDFFTYTLEDNDTGDSDGTEDTHTATVTITQVGPRVWFVDDSAPADGRGVSHAPLQTLAPLATGGAHETRDGSGDHIFVYAGTYPSGIDLEATQKLIGEPIGLNVGGKQFVAAGGTKPLLTSTTGDVVDLAAGNDVRGIAVDPQGTGGGIFGGAGDTGGTLDNVSVVDTVGTVGSGPGLELNGTGGDFTITDLTITNNATGVLLNANTGRTDFGSTSITSTGAPGLAASGTNMDSSTFDAITVTNSATGGVLLSNVTGATSIGDGVGTDLSLTTTSGATPAFKADNVTGLTVGAAGTDNVSATGGPAVDVVNAPAAVLDFDQVQSTNSPTDGVKIDGLTTGSFAAGAASAVTGAAGQAFDLNGGSGTISFLGALNDGSGGAAEVTGRSGGSVTVSGAINDSNDNGGGISLSANTGGSTTFSGATKTLNTATADAVSFNNSDGHTLNLTGGGLDIDTTTGDGVLAATAGTLSVNGSGNTVQTVTGRAVNVQNTDLGGGGFVFQSVGANGAVNGILLHTTGTAAGMTISGNGTNNSGGTIANTTQDAVKLTSTAHFNADELSITGSDWAGVDGTRVTDFTFTDGQILNAGDSKTNNAHAAIAFNDVGAANENNVDGALTITGNLLKDHYGGGIDVFNHAGTISVATISSNVIDSVNNLSDSHEDAISFNLFGNASTAASLTKATIASNTITDHPNGHGIVILGSQPTTGAAPTPTVGTPGNATNRVHITTNSIVGDPTLKLGGAGVQVGVEGRGQGNYHVTNNSPVNNVGTHGITGGNSGSSSVDYTISGNSVTANNAELGAIGIRMANDKHIMLDLSTLATPTTRARIENNMVRNTTGSGMRVLQGNSNGTMHAIVNGNDIANGGAGTAAIRVENGTSNDAAWDPAMCATMNGNTTAANAPTGGGNTYPGIALFKRGSTATTYDFGIVGLNPIPSSTTNTEGYVAGLNPNSNLGGGFYAGKRVTVDAGSSFYTNCTMPTGF